MKTIPAVAGEPIVYHDKTAQPLECCDCGLVHIMDIQIKKKKA